MVYAGLFGTDFLTSYKEYREIGKNGVEAATAGGDAAASRKRKELSSDAKNHEALEKKLKRAKRSSKTVSKVDRDKYQALCDKLGLEAQDFSANRKGDEMSMDNSGMEEFSKSYAEVENSKNKSNVQMQALGTLLASPEVDADVKAKATTKLMELAGLDM
jgi:hypothetical protein